MSSITHIYTIGRSLKLDRALNVYEAIVSHCDDKWIHIHPVNPQGVLAAFGFVNRIKRRDAFLNEVDALRAYALNRSRAARDLAHQSDECDEGATWARLEIERHERGDYAGRALSAAEAREVEQ